MTLETRAIVPTQGADQRAENDGPDPDQVFCQADLALHLDRLRRRAAVGCSRPKVSLDSLSRSTGIPRSTVHTYLSGTTLPSADALDSLVLALGCSPREVRAWGNAWERIADLGRGSRTVSRSANYSKFLAMNADVRRRLDRPTDCLYDLSSHVNLCERMQVGRRRQLDWLEVRTTLRAHEDGVDRCSLKFVGRPVFDLDRIEVTDTINCVPGEHRSFSDIGVRVLEVLFDGPIAAGETYSLEFRVDFLSAHFPDEVIAERGITWEAVDCGLHGFPRQGPAFTMEVAFDPDDLPCRIRQVQQDHAEAQENVVRALRPNAWNRVGMAVEHPVAGLHGIRWDWPDT